MSLEKHLIDSENSKGQVPVYYYVSPNLTEQQAQTGVVVIQEWWGVNHQIKSQAVEWFGTHHQVVLPDLYRGKVTESKEEAGHEMNHLDWSGAVNDIQAAVKFLHSKGAKKVGVVGFCMGGALTLAAASMTPEINAAAPFYGIPNATYFDVSKIKCPVQGHFGNADNLKGFTDIEAVNQLEERLKHGNVKYEIHRYSEADHAFCNPYTHDKPSNVKAAYESKQRVQEFFKKTLG